MNKKITFSLMAIALSSSFLTYAGQKEKLNVKSKKSDQTEINLTTSDQGDAMITYSHVYHLTMEQLGQLKNENVDVKVNLDNRILSYNLKNKENGSGIPTYNFKNLPGIDGQVHVLWLSTDLKKVGTQVFNFEPTERLETLSLVMPKNFSYNNFDQCNTIIMTYQLKETENPVNVIRYNYAKEDAYGEIKMVISQDKPSFCEIKAPDLRDTATIADNHVVNFSVNPKQTAKKGKLHLTAHTTEDGQMKLIEANETILIKKDFSTLNFITAQEPKGASDMMRKFYGVPFISDKIESGDYIIGIKFNGSKTQPWAWAQVNVK